MPSLRQKVTTYFRQLSFIAEPRDGARSPRKNEDDGNFIIKYLEGRMDRIFLPGPEIYNGQNPTDLPELRIASYPTGPHTITAACTGPDDGLTGIKRSKLHLSASYADDIDFIDTIQESDYLEVRKSMTTTNNPRNLTKFNRFTNSRKMSCGGSSTATTPTSDQNANKTFGFVTTNVAGSGGMRSRKNSKTNIANLQQKQQQTTVDKLNATKCKDNSNKSTTIVVSMVSNKKSGATGNSTNTSITATTNAVSDQNNKNLLNAKTEPTMEMTKDLANNTTPTTNIESNVKANNISITNGSNVTTTKLLHGTTERLLMEAVTNQPAAGCNGLISNALLVEPIAGVTNWRMETESAYGISVSLYENNLLTKEHMGSPIADCYGLVARGDVAVMALADGVNWGDGARLAARSAVHGCLDYLDRAVFGMTTECVATSTHEVFVSLLRALWEGHSCILEVGGALSTLTIAVVLPLTEVIPQREESGGDGGNKYVVCACNVGDSLGYVYSKTYGVREFTQASHDISSMRDMRDALGALGPADGNKPELSNLTLSMTIIESGDIVFLTSDGISDNFDPVVGKFAEAWTPDVKLMSTTTHGGLAPKRQNKSASALYNRLQQSNDQVPPARQTRMKKSASPENVTMSATNCRAVASAPVPSRPKYMRSHTVIEPRRLSSNDSNPLLTRQNTTQQQQQQHKATAHLHQHHRHQPIISKIPKSVMGLPLVTGPQRHALTLHRLEDLLSYGINGTFSPCVSARRLCHLLIDFARMITSARRKTLEQRELFYKLSTGPDGVRREIELNRVQHRAARKRIVDSNAFVSLPGKLDHATVVAFTVGGNNYQSSHDGTTTDEEAVVTNTTTKLPATSNGRAPLQPQDFQETNF